MSISLHVICPDGHNLRHLGNFVYETGRWTVSEDTARRVTRVHIHEKQQGPAYQGGDVMSWRADPEGTGRFYFTYRASQNAKIHCPGNWAQELAIIRREDH
ncbi:hypothetical protein [Mesorhizobium sp.]|uniref:hypothetical protein n=1 Tax=Mesorhizobium sp. TaxID=1871066 RepID=UPI000FE9408A|nr:hypothetical protein [Mesorhizobium sp.]RWO88609.1 MAG: hypothetical protein EOQ95_18595 [Mesorhizobium sp.]